MHIFSRGLRWSAAGILSAAVALTAVGVIGGPAHSEERSPTIHDKVLEHEQLISSCMRDRGFEYAVAVPSDLRIEDARRAAEASAADQSAAMKQAAKDLPPDPNQTIIGQLSKPARTAWLDALWGTDSTLGCNESTLSTAFGADLDAEQQRAEAVLAQVEREPAVVAASAAYVGCMAGRGYTAKDTTSIFAWIDDTAESMKVEAGVAFRTKAYDAHEACIAPYNDIYNGLQEKLLGVN